jgi:hypothetical protein
MAGVTFDFHYLALTWFAYKWLVVSNYNGAGGGGGQN